LKGLFLDRIGQGKAAILKTEGTDMLHIASVSDFQALKFRARDPNRPTKAELAQRILEQTDLSPVVREKALAFIILVHSAKGKKDVARHRNTLTAELANAFSSLNKAQDLIRALENPGSVLRD